MHGNYTKIFSTSTATSTSTTIPIIRGDSRIEGFEVAVAVEVEIENELRVFALGVAPVLLCV